MSAIQYDRDAISSALLSSLGTVYDCKRTWSAWSQGTMGPDDFVPFDMQDDRIEEVVDAVIAALPNPQASDVVLQRLSERIDNIVSLAKVRFPDVATLESAWEAIASDRNRLEAQLAQQAAKCDGNHGGPRCADPECWNDTDQCQQERKENLELRRMLCLAHAGAQAYMDDGEAQDSSVMPTIDYLCDSLDEIKAKRTQRAYRRST